MKEKGERVLHDGAKMRDGILLLGSRKEMGFIKSAITGGAEAFNESAGEVYSAPNKVIPNIFERPIFKMLIRYKLGFFNQPNSVKEIEWNWNEELPYGGLGSESQIVICKVPANDYEWRVVKKLREKYDSRVICVHELVLPFTMIEVGQASFNYYVKGLEAVAPYYTGEKYFGPIDALDKLFPLHGKSVIEFGPMEGCQTAGLIRAGAKSVTCIEARPENAIKTLIASYVFGWFNVNLIMDDFHNVDNVRYKTYDLAFAHGVYYHSESPFLFLENLISLSNNIFLGGYCATESLPYGDYLELDYFGKKYRAKQYEEADHYTAGINRVGYFFHRDDLISFFHGKNYDVVIVSDEESAVTAGKYLRLFARKKP